MEMKQASEKFVTSIPSAVVGEIWEEAKLWFKTPVYAKMFLSLCTQLVYEHMVYIPAEEWQKHYLETQEAGEGDAIIDLKDVRELERGL